MSHIYKHTGKAMTAIAAAVVFASTPLFAQETSAPPGPAAETPVETPTAIDPLAPEPTANEAPAVMDDAVPPAPKPKVETTAAAASQVKPSATSPARSSAGQRASASITAAAAVAPANEMSAPAQLPEPQPPTTTGPAAPLVVDLAPASNIADTLMPDLIADNMIPVAGAAALGLLALGGTGIALRRRKRRRANDAFEIRQQALAMIDADPILELDPAAQVRPAPSFARSPAPMRDPVPSTIAPAAKLPEDQPQVRVGRHVQAAYRGPTADNPSVSLEYGLRRASEMGQQERKHGEISARPPSKFPTQGNWEARSDADFLFRRTGKNAKRPVEPS